MQSSTYGTNTAWNTCTLNTSKKKLLIKKIQNTVNCSQGRSLFQPHIYNNFFLPGINNSL